MPARASRSPRFSALVRPFLRMAASAASKSPFTSCRARLASVMPTPVSSRRRLISSMLTAMLSPFLFLFSCFVFVVVGFVYSGSGLGPAGGSGFHRLFRVAGDQLDCLDGVVVARHREVNRTWVGVSVYQGDDRQAELAGFLDSVDVGHDIKNKHRAGLGAHVFDAAVQK